MAAPNGTFVRRNEFVRDEATYFEESRHRDEVIYPHAPPDPVDYQDFNPRRSRRYLTFFLHPARDIVDVLLGAQGGGQRMPISVPGYMSAWNHRYNVYTPTPETFGSRYVMGEPE